MSKPNRETQLRLGAQRLQEWGLSADATVDALRAAVGRDPAADLAIAARLGARADAASVDALHALDAASADKLVHKARAAWSPCVARSALAYQRNAPGWSLRIAYALR